MARYIELADILQRRIAEGVYADRLPSVLALAEELEVNPNTIQRTLELLKSRGCVYSIGGKGVFVADAGRHGPNRVVTVYAQNFFSVTNPFYMLFLEKLHSLLAAQHVTMDMALDFRLPDPSCCQGVLTCVTSLEEDKYQDLIRRIAPHKVHLCDWYGANRSAVNSDNFAGGRMAVSHLYEKGHRQIGVFSYDTLPGFSFDARLKGALSVTGEHDDCRLEIVDLPWVSLVPHDDLIECGLDELLERMPGVTAIFAFNDQLAFETIMGLKKRNIRVPDDISVMGFDNRSFAGLCDPPLSTVEESYAELARLAAGRLLHPRLHPGEPLMLLAAPRLVLRQSVRNLNVTPEIKD